MKKIKPLYIWLALAVLSLILGLTPSNIGYYTSIIGLTPRICYNTAVGGTLVLTAPLGLGTGYLSSLLLITEAAADWAKPLKLFIAWLSFYAGGFIQWFIIVPFLVRLFRKKPSDNTSEAETDGESGE